MKIKDRLRGVLSVFRFTLAQLFKNKANLVSLIIMFVFSLISVPLFSLFTNTDSLHTASFKTVYIDNRTNLALDAENAATALSTDKIILKKDHTPSDDEVVIKIFNDNSGVLSADITCSNSHSFPASDLDFLKLKLQGFLQNTLLSLEDITQAQLETIGAQYTVYVDDIDNFSNSSSAQYLDQTMSIQLFYSILVMSLGIFSVSYIIRTVVDEKSSKLIELLLLSISPLALIIGKILAAMTYIAALFASIISGAIISFFITGQLIGNSAVTELVPSIIGSFDLGVMQIIVIALSCIVGYLTFAFIAGISGAGVSSVEESSNASLGSMIIIFSCYLLSIIAPAISNDGGAVICSLIPYLSIFCMPVQFVLGNISIYVVIASLAIQLAIVVLLCIICAKVYRDLILYKGKPLGFLHILKMANLFNKKEVSQDGV